MATTVQLKQIPLPSTTVMPDGTPTRTRVYNRIPGGGRYKNKLASEKDKSKWELHQFICYDGEGYDINGRHEYVYLCAYDGSDYREIRNDKGLSTHQSFRFLIETASHYKHGINVIYGGSYDSNMILRDLSVEKLESLHKTTNCRWQGYYIEYVARKYLQVTHLESRRSIRLWDVIGFFQATFQDSLKTWLDLSDTTIAKGKKGRHSFKAEQLDFIMAYCQKELYYFEQLMQRLWECLNAAGIKLNRWDGAGAAAASLLKTYGVYTFKGSPETQAEHYHLARAAYAGGRFELIRPGDYQQEVYNYDINSAYPYGMTQLPEFTGLVECRKKDHSKCIIEKYDLVQVDYEGDILDPFYPYFHRDRFYSVSFPRRHIGWHWAPEYNMAARYGNAGNILLHYKLHDNGKRPFSWVATLYDKRKALKARGDKAEYALKLALNALYGKLVQQKGWKPGSSIPITHQLYWGGWITSLTRSMLYEAMMQKPHSVISVDTDGIFTTEKLDLPEGKGLGEWGLTTVSSLTIVQSGVYFYTRMDGTEVAKYRGMDKGSLKREHIYKGWEKKSGKVKAYGTRFRTIGTSLVGTRMAEWRQWIKEPKEVAILSQVGKRRHYCTPGIRAHTFKDGTTKNIGTRICVWGKGHSHTTLPLQPENLESLPYNVLWDNTADKEKFYNVMDEAMEGDIIGE